MSNKKIKVAGYSQKITYSDGIEYRDFSPDLVGLQLASNGGTPLFTMGSFSIDTNMDSKSDKTYITKSLSNFITLTDINLDNEQTTLFFENKNAKLNLDKRNINYYALFGSLTEFVRVSLENIITTWPASLYVHPISQTIDGKVLNGYTFEDYQFDSIHEISTFKINTNFLNNKFQINYLKNGTILDTFNETNDLRNITINYESYSILFENIEYSVLGFTGSTDLKNDYVYLKVKGNPFSGFSTSSKIDYHIKPNSIKEGLFFSTLPDFETYLLSRQTNPLYTATFNYPIKSDDGIILYKSDSITWPVSDGYNIDFDTTYYVDYATKILEIASNNDLYSSDLMNRFLVSESISNFDTTPVHLDPAHEDSSGQKMNKTLQIYGRSFDEINNYITGIEYANVVTYNKMDNTPDLYLKNLAKVLGWELVSSILDNDLLSNYIVRKPTTLSGQSAGLTASEADVELWRRIILNTPWIWKSKGARKSVEFLLKFIGAPKGLIKFNEYIYKAEAPIDVELFKKALILNDLEPDISLYPIDSDGYPRPLPNTSDMYFQNDGLWYRETGGLNPMVDKLEGNNPHVGLYDGGFKYMNQFVKLIPNFSATTVSSTTITSGSTNLFVNYNLGEITDYSGNTYVDGINNDGSDLNDCFVVTTSIIKDPMPSLNLNNCGCNSISNDDALSICVDVIDNILPPPCSPDLTNVFNNPSEHPYYIFNYIQHNHDGTIYVDSSNNPINKTSLYTNKACCESLNGKPFKYDQIINGVIVNTGNICCNNNGSCGCFIACNWTAELTTIVISNDTYVVFKKPDASLGIVSPDGCNCINTYTTPVSNISDPYTGQIGYGCKLTIAGLNDIQLGTSSVLYNKYLNRKNGTESCYQ